nr:two-component regulator propeller domain-containing protein [uncultured Dethiosulfovibrio sp.]
MTKRTLISILIFTLSLISSAGSAKDEIIFENLSLQEGLSQTTVKAILMDSRGYMWFGTDGGLNRYDGYQFKVYRRRWNREDGISDNSVTSVVEGPDGELWIGTMAGLNRMDLETESFQRFTGVPGDEHSLMDDRVTSLKIAGKDSLWVGTRAGLERMSLREHRFYRYRELGGPEELVNTVTSDLAGTIWVGTEKGLYQGGIGGFHLHTLPFVSQEDREVTAILEDHRHRLWIGTRAGRLYSFDREGGYFSPPEPLEYPRGVQRSISSIYEDIFGELWIGTDGGGIVRFNPDSRYMSIYRKDNSTPHGLRDNVILSIWGDTGNSIHMGDLTGVIWFGTFSNGIEKVHLKRPFQRYDSRSYNVRGLVGEDVRALWKDDDGPLWAGTYGGGLREIDGRKETISYWRHDPIDPYSLTSDRVMSLLRLDDETLLVGTDGGLDVKTEDRFEPIRFPSILPPPSVKALMTDEEGKVWIGTSRGLFYLHGDRAIPFLAHKRLSRSDVTAIIEDESRTLWLGTDGDGLFALSPSRDSCINMTSHLKDGPLSDRIHSLFSWNKELWIGTDLGLQWIGEGRSRAYTSEDGLPGDVVKGILRNRYGQLWLSTDNGLSRLDPKTGEIRNYTLGDGLQGKEFNRGAAVIDRFGKMYFGGTKGCNSFYPGNISENDHIPPVVINEVSVFGKPVPMDRSTRGFRRVTLTQRQNYITIHFAALDYTAPESNEYRYILEGFDEDWIHSGNRNDASYTNLPDGRYLFRVKGSNNNGVWNEEGAVLEIDVIPPLWRTPLAYGVYLFCLGSLAYFAMIYSRNIREKETERKLRLVTEISNLKLTEKNRQLEQARRHETFHRERLRSLATSLTEAEERERRQIATEVHDSIGQNLALSKLRLEMLAQSLEKPCQEEIGSITSMLDQTIRSTRTLTFELGTPVLYRFGFFPAIERLSERFEEDYGLSIKSISDGEIPEMNDDMKAFLFRAVRELAMNTVKHAKATTLTVRTKVMENRLYLSASDDGQGFDVSTVEHTGRDSRSFGLFSLRERIISLGGRMVIRSIPGEGTSVRLFVPFRKERDN